MRYRRFFAENLETFDAIIKSGSLDLLEGWSIVEEVSCALNLIESWYHHNSKKIPLEKVEASIRKKDEKSFYVDTENMVFDCTHYEKNNWHELFSIIQKKPLLMDWGLWVHRLSANADFLQAWYADREYHHWAMEEDVDFYSRMGKSHAHLPKKDTGLPPPLNDPIIDISHNPGRRVIRGPYVEAVAAEMWLGQGFWELTGADREAVKTCDFLKTEEQDYGVLNIKAGPRVFTSDEGEEAEIQNRMRRLLYPRSVDLPIDQLVELS